MKYFFSLLISIIIFVTSSFAQSPEEPFKGHHNIVKSNELALFWNYHASADSTVYHQVFSYAGNSGKYIIDSSEKGSYNGDLGTVYNQGYIKPHINVVTGDFYGDSRDDIVAAWNSAGNSLNIVVPQIAKGKFTWSSQNVLKLTGVLYPVPVNSKATRFKLIEGNFDTASHPGFALAYWDQTGHIQIRIYYIDPSTGQPVEKGTVNDFYMDPAHDNAGFYDIAAADLNGDGKDEIILSAYDNSAYNTWAVSTEIYDCESSGVKISIVPKAKKSDMYTSSDFLRTNYVLNNIAVAGGYFQSVAKEEFVVDFVLTNNSEGTINYVLPAYTDSALTTINVNLDNLVNVHQSNGDYTMGISAVTGDINNDGKDELVLGSQASIYIYDIDSTMKLNEISGSVYGSDEYANGSILLADLNASLTDSVWNPEIVYTSTSGNQLKIGVQEPIIDPSGDITSIEDRLDTTIFTGAGTSQFYWGIAAGDFNDQGIRLGTPKYYHVTNLVQPLVILNAPPVHFDVFNDSAFDIDNFFNGQQGDFYSSYFNSSESEIEVESETHSSWSIGASVEGGFEVPIIKTGVKIKLDADYGRDFSKVKTNTHTFKINQNITASGDDYIYATISDYDVWEYPIIANDSIKGYTLVVSPTSTQNAWFPSKSPEADDYLPDHEVGNILSYRSVTSPSDNSAFKTAVKWNSTDQVTLTDDPLFSFQWSLENSNSTQTTTSNKVSWNLGSEISFESAFKFVPDISIKGNYSHDNVSTQTNTATFTKGLDVHLGPITGKYGDAYYSVTPYAYWATNGALVLNYAVTPSAAVPGKPETWWQQKYGHKSDPALILPWRLDNYKGGNISAEELQETKEIQFSKENPTPGDTINVQVRVHNFSLINTPSPVEAEFYLGDPSNGGTLMQSITGASTFSTSDYIPARGSKIISFNWIFPADAPYNPKIYVVLDPNNKIDEVHESNNVGWNLLTYTGGTTAVRKNTSVVESFRLEQNYPNPFNPTTTIRYSIPQVRFVTLKVYDILGRLVKTLVNRQEMPGMHEVQFDGSDIASGVYFYRIQAGGFISAKKFVLLK